MFKLQHRTTLACTLCMFASIACAQTHIEGSAESINTAPSSVASTVSQWSEAASIPGVAIAYIHDSQVRWFLTDGKSNSEHKVTADTLFNIASLTKPLFSMMTLQLVENDKLDLDESLSQYWIEPDIKDDSRHKKLTPRLALSHQTGFANWRGDKPLSFMFEPGQRHEYSGEGFEYLKTSLENKLSKTMPQLMAHYVTSPSGMNNTYFGWQDKLNHDIADRYDEAGEIIPHKQFYRDSYSAACCTLSSVKDYAKFIQWVSQGAGLSKSLLQQLQAVQAQHKNPTEYFGLGWRLVKTSSTTYLVHDGREPGVRALTIVSPKTREGLVILTNSSNGELIYRPIVQQVLKESQAYLSQTDKDTWQYLTSIPAEMQTRMIGFIAQSPSFASKALYASNEMVLIQKGGKADSEELSKLKQQSAALIDAYILELHSAKSRSLQDKLRQKFIDLMQFLSTDKDQIQLTRELNKSITINAWTSQLADAVKTDN